MVGQGVVQECLSDPDVRLVQTIGRRRSGVQHPKLCEILHSDLSDYSSIQNSLSSFDACFFCLGVSSFRMKEEDYERVTYGMTLEAAKILSQLNPQMTFIYVSGAGTDSSEHGRTMWARVKGKTENALLGLPFKAAYMFRPGVIQPVQGARSKTASYRVLYGLTQPLLPLLRQLFPNAILTTAELGRAMLIAAKRGAPKPVLETWDIRALLQ
jgi:hypothetical protein